MKVASPCSQFHLHPHSTTKGGRMIDVFEGTVLGGGMTTSKIQCEV